MGRPGITILVLLLAGGVAAGFYAVRRNAGSPAVEAPRVVHAERGMVGNTVNATGTVRLRVGSEVRVGSQLSGIVKKLNVTVGSQVHAGDLIAEIDDAPIQARLAQAEAQAQLDRASLDRARQNFERARELMSQGLIPAQQEQDLELALAEAKARYDKSLRDRDVVQVDLRYVAIRAPIAGTVSSVSTQEGETVAAAFTAPTFVTIIGENALQLVAMVDETDIANVRPGNPVVFTVDSYPARDFPGAVVSVAPKATIVSGVVNYEVTINIRKDAHLLKPDMTANVSVKTVEHAAMLLPAAAVQRDGDQSFVYVQGKSGRDRRPVVVGTKENGRWEIKRGISDNDDVLLILASGTASTRPAQAVP